MQLAATHAGRGELYVIVHPTSWSEGKGDHDFPGPEVWVYDVETRQRVRRLKLGFEIRYDFIYPDAFIRFLS